MQDPIEAFFAGYPPEVQSISRTLRAMVLNARNPALKQLVEDAWAEALTHMKKKQKI